MELLTQTFNALLYQPLFNALVLFYDAIPGRDLGAAIIVLTLLVRFAFWPLTAKGMRAQKRLSDLQPEVKKLQEKNKNNREKLAKETLELYKKAGVNPFAGIAPVLVQLPILLALYRLFLVGVGPDQLASQLYSFVPNPGAVDPLFLNLIDLTRGSGIMAGVVGAAQFAQMKLALGKEASKMQKQMAYMFPVVAVVIIFNLPSAVGLYWAVTAAVSVFQQYRVNSHDIQRDQNSG